MLDHARIDLAPKTVAGLDCYRRSHKATAGKMITRQRAANEIIQQACGGIQEPEPVTTAELYGQIVKLEKRVTALEAKE